MERQVSDVMKNMTSNNTTCYIQKLIVSCIANIIIKCYKFLENHISCKCNKTIYSLFCVFVKQYYMWHTKYVDLTANIITYQNTQTRAQQQQCKAQTRAQQQQCKAQTRALQQTTAILCFARKWCTKNGLKTKTQ